MGNAELIAELEAEAKLHYGSNAANETADLLNRAAATLRQQAGRVDDSMQQRAEAWEAVVDVLREVCPRWHEPPMSGLQCAALAIRGLADRANLVLGEKTAYIEEYDLDGRHCRGLVWADHPANTTGHSFTPLHTVALAQNTQGDGEPVARAWDEGYRQGVTDERASDASIGIAGFDAKVEPARENPYRKRLHAERARVPEIDAEDWKVLQRLRDALPTVGLNGWLTGVRVLNKLLAAAPSRPKDAGEVSP